MTESVPFNLPPRLFSSSSTCLLIKTVDYHCGGEPARIVFDGVPKFPKTCNTALLKRKHMMEVLDYIREILLLEPRGYPCQNVDFVFRPSSDNPNQNIQYVIGEQNKIYPLMSGHNTIACASAILECGVVKMEEPSTQFTMESPGGPINIVAECSNGKVKSITLRNSPSFVRYLDIEVNVPHNVGNVKLDIAFGGMWYAVVDLAQFNEKNHLNMSLDPSNGKELCRVGEMIKVACREQYPVNHPDYDYPGVDILVFRDTSGTGSNTNYNNNISKLRVVKRARNTVVMSNNNLDWDKPETFTAMLDRSPCGTGTCAVMAVLHARGELFINEPFLHESIVGSKFKGEIVEETQLDDGTPAIIVQITGSAYATQACDVVVDPTDPFPRGYRVGDIW
eukprot:Awhi_evm1s2832